MAAERDGYKGTAEDYSKTVIPLMEKKGLLWTQYRSAEKKISDAKLVHGEHGGVQGEIDVLAAHYNLHASMSFTKKTVEKGLVLALRHMRKTSTNSAKFKMTKDEEKDWVDLSSRRIRNLCRVVGQAESKRVAPHWLQTMPWKQGAAASGSKDETADVAELDEDDQDEEGEEEEDDDGGDEKAEESEDDKPLQELASKKPSAEAASPYTISFSKELMLPIRVDAKGKQEPGVVDEPIKNAPGTAALMFSWPDGYHTVYKSMTYDDLGSMLKSSKTNVNSCEWEGETKGKNKLTICQRVDRNLLLSLYEQSKQVLMVKLNLWGKIENEHERLPQTSEILVKAVDFMKHIAAKFAKGDILRADLKKYRDEHLVSLGVVKESKRTRAHAETVKQRKAGQENDAQNEAELKPKDADKDASAEVQPKKGAKPKTKPTTTKKRAAQAQEADQETERPNKAAATEGSVKSSVTQSSVDETDPFASFLDGPPTFDSLAALSHC